MKGALEEAAAQACVIAKTCDDAAQDERYRVEQEHLDALTRLRDDHTKASDGTPYQDYPKRSADHTIPYG